MIQWAAHGRPDASRLLPVLLSASLALTGCAGSATPSSEPIPTTQPTPTPSATQVPLPTESPSQPPEPPSPSPIATASAVPETCAIRTLDAMSEEQRIGQMFMIGLTGDSLAPADRAAVEQYHFGSFYFASRTDVGVLALRSVADAIQLLATASATAGVRFFVAANQEGGEVQALAGPGFDTIPSALTQGTMPPDQLRQAAATWAAQLLAAGVNLDLAPVADVVPAGSDTTNQPIGAYDREYGHDPGSVSDHVAAFVAGMTASGVSTTAKHFPGLGRVTGNTDFTADVVDSVTTRDDPYLQPFATAIGAGVRAVMVSLATYQLIDPDHIAAFSDTVINGMLRGDLGFRGFVMSDSLSAVAVQSLSPADRAFAFVNAGGDMIVINDLQAAEQMAQAMTSFAATHDWFAARVENAAWHVLRGKEEAGLLRC